MTALLLDPHTQPRRFSSAGCRRHPALPITGFCAACLSERLSGLAPDTSSSSSSSAAANVTAAASELRRSKSCAGRNAPSALSEPRRKSCDDRARSSLQHLFVVDDNHRDRDVKIESENLGLARLGDRRDDRTRGVVRPVRVCDDVLGKSKNYDDDRRVAKDFDIVVVEEEEGGEEEGDLKTMKEHIDLEMRSKKQHNVRDFKDIAGSLASVFSKKFQKWKLKQKPKKQQEAKDSGFLARRVKEERKSEVAADYGFGRRSCDTDPRRFSVDEGRISLDCPGRFSLDETHRASWDGYLIARTIPRLTPMLSVVESRFDNGRVSVENDQINSILEDETTSGGSCQTSSSSQRRSSFDRGSSGKNSTRKGYELGIDEVKNVLNGKTSPPSGVEIFHGTRLVITDTEFGDLNPQFVKDDQCIGSGDRKGVKKSSGWRKVWKIWGPNYEDARGNVVQRSLEDCCQEQVGVANQVVKGEPSSSPTLIRSSSCVGSRSSVTNSTSVAETGSLAKKNKEEFVLDRQQSVRYSPSHADNGLLRFYLTPLRSARSKSGKSRLHNSNSVARGVFRLN